MEKCPSCGTETPLDKTWLTKIGRYSPKRPFRIFLYKCPKCGRSFRTSKPEEGSQ